MADPMDLILANAKKDSDDQIAWYIDHLEANVSAYRQSIKNFDRDQLIQLSVKSLMESDNSRENLCYKVTVAIDMLARMK